MTIKLSTHKIARLLTMYLKGDTQLAIEAKLGINQGSVSHYVSEFSMVAEEEGLEAAAEEYGVMDIVKDLHSLGAEVKKSHLTIEEAKKALKVAVLLEECGVPEDKIQRCRHCLYQDAT